jgi:hypothetical protein
VDPAIQVGTLDISSSVTIDCSGSYGAIFAFSGENAVTMSTAGISVTLRGLTIYSSPGSPGTTGVLFNGGSDLTLENVKIFGFTSTGIKFTPSTSGSKLVVSDTTLSNNGNGSTGGGIVISPQSGGTAQVTLNRVTASKNVFGIVADGTGSTNGINMTIADSV